MRTQKVNFCSASYVVYICFSLLNLLICRRVCFEKNDKRHYMGLSYLLKSSHNNLMFYDYFLSSDQGFQRCRSLKNGDIRQLLYVQQSMKKNKAFLFYFVSKCKHRRYFQLTTHFHHIFLFYKTFGKFVFQQSVLTQKKSDSEKNILGVCSSITIQTEKYQTATNILYVFMYFLHDEAKVEL